MPNPTQLTSTAAPVKTDVLQAGPHAMLTSEEIAKAIARHKREHPQKAVPAKQKKRR